jgi:hypothetical protein
MGDGASSNGAQPVHFGKILYFDDGFHVKISFFASLRFLSAALLWQAGALNDKLLFLPLVCLKWPAPLGVGGALGCIA